MYWKFDWAEAEGLSSEPDEGRFVLHRHDDGNGAHLDLRLEQAGFLSGWRLVGETLKTARYGTSKTPHPVTWLEEGAGAQREDGGTFAWNSWDGTQGELELRGTSRVLHCAVTRLPEIPVEDLAALMEQLRAHDRDLADLSHLIDDGVTARSRSLARLCALGKELDGEHFDERSWRGMLSSLSLKAIDDHLHGFEVRFDAKYPPQPASVPESLPETGAPQRDRAWEILSEV